MEFVALGIWFIFHPGFLSYLQDFPRFWLQLDWEARRRGEESRGLGRGEREGAGGEKGRQSWSLSHTTQHSWTVRKNGKERGEIVNGRRYKATAFKEGAKTAT